jgi:hypothetical protein
LDPTVHELNVLASRQLQWFATLVQPREGNAKINMLRL